VHRIIRPDSEGHVFSAAADRSEPLNDDALVNSKLCPIPGAERLRVSQFSDLQRLRRLLRDGCEGHIIEPFIFRVQDTALVVAENSGLEGFVFSQRKFEERFGSKASEAHTTDYFIYVASVLEGEGYGHILLKKVRQLASSELPLPEKHRALIDLVRTQVSTWREEVKQLDSALWARHVRAYQVFPRTFNIDGFREIHGITPPVHSTSSGFFENITGADIDAIRGLGFSAIRLMGVFPIGSTNAKGTAGGSPYSILAHDIDPAHGSRSEAKRSFDLAYERGVLSIFEVVPNHTSCDSVLLRTNPDFFVHTRERPVDTSGYFFYEHPKYGEYWIRYGGYRELGSGRREFWTDTLQLDFSRPETREYVISEICDLIRNYNLDGIRVDSAYQLLNEYLQQNWGKTVAAQESELAFALPSREFLADLVTRVKYEFPNVVIMAEAFTSFDRLAECGVDLIYGISSMPRRGKHTHTGWHEALESRNPEKIRAAIKRAEFLSWQVGGPDIVTFFGHQDFPSPRRMFGEEWVYGAAVLSILRPGASSFYAGTEACYEEPCDEPGFKVVSFNKPAKIKWEGTSEDLGRFQIDLLRLSRSIQNVLGERTTLEAIESDTDQERCDWVGYIVRSADPSVPWKLAVVVNTASRPVDVTFTDPDTDEIVAFSLPAAGPEGYNVVQLDTSPKDQHAIFNPKKERLTVRASAPN
jgi:hypothetical protein